MARTDREAKERLLAIRVPQSLLDSIDRQVERMQAQVPWVQPTRSDVVRWFLTNSIERFATDPAFQVGPPRAERRAG